MVETLIVLGILGINTSVVGFVGDGYNGLIRGNNDTTDGAIQIGKGARYNRDVGRTTRS